MQFSSRQILPQSMDPVGCGILQDGPQNQVRSHNSTYRAGGEKNAVTH